MCGLSETLAKDAEAEFSAARNSQKRISDTLDSDPEIQCHLSDSMYFSDIVYFLLDGDIQTR